MAQSQYEKVGVVTKAVRLRAAAVSGHVIFESSHFFSGIQDFDIDPENQVTVYSAVSTVGEPGYFTSRVMPGYTLQGVLRRQRSVRRQLLEDVPAADLRRGDCLLLNDSNGHSTVYPRLTSAIAVPISDEERNRAESLALNRLQRMRVGAAAGAASIAGLIGEAAAQVPAWGLITTGVAGLGSLVYAYHQGDIGLDYAARANSPETIEQTMAKAIAAQVER